MDYEMISLCTDRMLTPTYEPKEKNTQSYTLKHNSNRLEPHNASKEELSRKIYNNNTERQSWESDFFPTYVRAMMTIDPLFLELTHELQILLDHLKRHD